MSIRKRMMLMLFTVHRILWTTRKPWKIIPGMLGLVSATIGAVEDIIWECGAESSDLPSAVLVSCKDYKDPTLWQTEPREGFPEGIPIVPITPWKTSFESQLQPMARTQLPLRLAWVVTVHKSQGLMLPRIRLGLGKNEFSCGLTFVALSRVIPLNGLLFIIEKLDWERVEKLGRKFLQLRLEDLARGYQVTYLNRHVYCIGQASTVLQLT
jgi:hypothetical protein